MTCDSSEMVWRDAVVPATDLSMHRQDKTRITPHTAQMDLAAIELTHKDGTTIREPLETFCMNHVWMCLACCSTDGCRQIDEQCKLTTWRLVQYKVVLMCVQPR